MKQTVVFAAVRVAFGALKIAGHHSPDSFASRGRRRPVSHVVMETRQYAKSKRVRGLLAARRLSIHTRPAGRITDSARHAYPRYQSRHLHCQGPRADDCVFVRRARRCRGVRQPGQELFSFPQKFFLLGGVWLAAMEGEPPVERTYRHLAFKVEENELSEFQSRLQALGVEVKTPRPRVEGEGLSLYFYDFDNHLFELHTGTLEQRLARYAS
nr:hypothetical protein [Andreprevotia chitinilytica]